MAQERSIESEGLPVMLYTRPFGRRTQLTMTHIFEDDLAFFKEKEIDVSMEDSDFGYILYADVGKKDEDGQSLEVIHISRGQTCYHAMRKLRQLCEEELL